jgi:uncharacterized membrane protein YccC
MNDAADWKAIRNWIAAHRAQLRFSLRMTIAGLTAFAVGQVLAVPLHGLWMILTAIVVTQMSTGGSLRATLEYIVGTIGGAVYAAIVGALIPHATAVGAASALALAIAPLALAAAINPNFRVAPFSAVLVLLIAGQFDEGPVESAFIRSLEVALGGVIAVVVSLLVFPERAHGLGRKAAVRILEQLARVLPQMLNGFIRDLDAAEIRRIQDDIGSAVAAFQQITAEVKHELLITPTADPDPGPLSRTLLRLRHDLVIIGRAAAKPLPEALRGRLSEPLTRVGSEGSRFLRDSASALGNRSGPPPLDAFEAALAAYVAEVEAARSEGLTLPLTSNEVEPLFALGFALEQLRQNFIDLRRCVQDYARRASATSRTSD